MTRPGRWAAPGGPGADTAGPAAVPRAVAGAARARAAEGTVLTSSLDPASAAYRANREAQLQLLDELAAQLEQVRAGGGPRYAQRHRERGRLLARERIELLLDRDAHFLELSTLAAWGTEFTVGASEVTGIGVVSGWSAC